MIDWDYFPYLWLVYYENHVAIKDFNGWLYYIEAETIGM